MIDLNYLGHNLKIQDKYNSFFICETCGADVYRDTYNKYYRYNFELYTQLISCDEMIIKQIIE